MDKSQKLLLICFFLPLLLLAQETVEIQNNNLRAYLRADGGLINPNDIHWLSYEQDGALVPLAHYAGLWLGGLDPSGNLFVADLRNGGNAGPISVDAPYDKVWKISAQEIASHLADFEDNGIIDNPQAGIFAWPGRGNPHFFDYNPGLEPSSSSFGAAPFWDRDGNGLYNPSEGDYPILEVRGCSSSPIIPTEMNWCVYTVEDTNADSAIMEIQLNLFHFSCEETHPLNEALFISYKLIHWSDATYTDMYCGLFTDPDLGCPFDDYIGSLPERNVAYTYNASNDDEVCFTGLAAFGENPPVLATDVYRSPLTFVPIPQEVPLSSIMAYHSPGFGNPNPATTDPNLPYEYYNYLQGKWRDGTPMTIGGNGYGGLEETSFAFPGLPEVANTWTEWQESNTPGDRRHLINFGPFDLLPGAVNEVIASYSLYTGPGNHLEKVEGMSNQSDQLQAYFDNCFDIENATGLPPCTFTVTGTDIKSSSLEPIVLFPNPARETVEIQTEANISKVYLFDTTGKQWYSGTGNSIAINSLPGGLYFVGIEINGQIVFRKLVKE
ncbi:MAG: T9SS type A sorting domain-containing protein [Chitinophagales bacterium]|nr:T9SS type A sorting domain-containing protein [Chitinophagales bacterium]